MKHYFLAITLIFISTFSFNSFSNDVITIETNKAPFYLGKKVIACGYVVQSKQFKGGVYLNFDSNYPNQSLTAILWKKALSDINHNLGTTNNLINKRLCVKGTIKNHKDNLQISINDAKSIWRDN
tara:strand:- start:225 stop:599 length:375 start_codon:yes stop_codon:yes gene_type:complete